MSKSNFNLVGFLVASFGCKKENEFIYATWAPPSVENWYLAVNQSNGGDSLPIVGGQGGTTPLPYFGLICLSLICTGVELVLLLAFVLEHCVSDHGASGRALARLGHSQERLWHVRAGRWPRMHFCGGNQLSRVRRSQEVRQVTFLKAFGLKRYI